MGTKACPYCAEDIKAEAIKCRHCGAMVTGKSGGGDAISGVATDRTRALGRRNIPLAIAGMLGVLVFGAATYWCWTTPGNVVRERTGIGDDRGLEKVVVFGPPVLGFGCAVIGFGRFVRCPYCGKANSVSVWDENCKCGKCGMLNVIIWE